MKKALLLPFLFVLMIPGFSQCVLNRGDIKITYPANATMAQKRDAVRSYLAGLAGKGVISGEYDGDYDNAVLDPFQKVFNATGKWIGFMEGGYWWFNEPFGQPAKWDQFNQLAINYWNAGGLIGVSAHMGNPAGGGCNATSINGADLVTPGTSTYNNQQKNLDDLAAGLKQLRDAGVVVILRPYHELNGNWFWWGTTNVSDAQIKTLWQHTYDYLVNTKGLDNLIWSWAANAGGTNNFNRYPGDAYVDIIGFDYYSSNVSGAVSSYNTQVGKGKIQAMTEFGPGSPSNGDVNFDERNLVNGLFNSMPNIVFWNQWRYPWSMDNVQYTKEALASCPKPLSNQPNATFCTAPVAPVIDGAAESSWDLIQANALANTVAGTATSSSDISATYKITWDNNNLYILVNVTDDVKKNDSGTNYWDDDAIELFIDGNNDKAASYDANDRQYIFRWNDNTIHQMSQGGSSNPTGVTFAQTNTPNGYTMEIQVAWSALGVTPAAAKLVGFDVHVDDDDDGAARDTKIGWYAQTDNSYTDPSTFGTIQLSSFPCAQLNSSFCAPASAPVIDGTEENLWSGIQANTLPNTIIGATTSAADLSATCKATWDNNNLYLLVNVTDDVKKNDSGNSPWDDDGIEVYIDGDNSKSTSYDADDRQFAFRWNDNTVYLLSQSSTNPAGVSFAQSNTANGYLMEIKIAWSAIGTTASAGKILGLDVHVNDDDNGGTRDNKISWIATSDVSWQDPSTFGNIKLSSTPCPTATGIVSADLSSGISVYPNPFSSSFTLNISPELALKEPYLKIYDVCGREVRKIPIHSNETTIDRGELQSGIYLYSIITNDQMISNGKLIIQ